MITPQSLKQQFNLTSLEADIDNMIRLQYQTEPTRSIFHIYPKDLPNWYYESWKVLAIAYNTFWNINTNWECGEISFITFYSK
jgi:hypothetical protein